MSKEPPKYTPWASLKFLFKITCFVVGVGSIKRRFKHGHVRARCKKRTHMFKPKPKTKGGCCDVDQPAAE